MMFDVQKISDNQTTKVKSEKQIAQVKGENQT